MLNFKVDNKDLMIFLECETSLVMSRTSSMCYMVVTAHENILLSFGRIKSNLKMRFFFFYYFRV